VDIVFKTTKLEKQCNSRKLLDKKYGSRRAALIRRRLDELRAATSLQEIGYLPQARCHELKGNLAGNSKATLREHFLWIWNTPIDFFLDRLMNRYQ